MVELAFPLLLAVGGPVVKNPTPLSSPLAQVHIPEQQYRIQVDNEPDIKLFYHQELNETVVARPHGRISLQPTGDVMAAGKSPAALSQ